MSPLGWRTPETLIGEQIRPDGGYGLAEASLVDGSVTPISQFSNASTCEIGTQQCEVWRIQLATNLLGAVGIRDGRYPDRGPWVQIVYIGTIPALVAVLALIVVPFIVRRIRGRRRHEVIPSPKLTTAQLIQAIERARR
jgi:hypothetical protein